MNRILASLHRGSVKHRLTHPLSIFFSLTIYFLGSETSLYTLSQTYEVTKYGFLLFYTFYMNKTQRHLLNIFLTNLFRHVTAVKTIPPLELYEFSPSKSFADIDALFQEAGSENREHLLPGELEFSDQVGIRDHLLPGELKFNDWLGREHRIALRS